MSINRLIMRRGITCAVLVVLATACREAAPIETYVADILPIKETRLANDPLIPWTDATASLLDEGWQPLDGTDATRDGLWVFGQYGSFRFFATRTDGLTIEMEASQYPHPNMPAQFVAVILNGVRIGVEEIGRQWKRYRVPLPADVARLGWNRVGLSFRHATQPRTIAAGIRDRRRLAARFRLLRVAGPDDGSSDKLDGLAVEYEPADSSNRQDEAIAMVGGSFVDMAIVPGDDTRLRARIGIDIASGGQLTPASVVNGDESGGQSDASGESDVTAGREVTAVVDLLDATGTEHVLYERTFDRQPWRTPRLDLSLGEWAGEPVTVRLRSSGNGTVRWIGAGLTAASDSFADPAKQPAAVTAAPSSGRFEGSDVVIILLDALRADAALGENGPPTPNIGALAAGGTTYTAAWAPSAWTGQSVPALLTGFYPDSIGAEVWGSPLPDEMMTVAEHFANAGYHTSLWSQHNVYTGNRTMRRGFAAYEAVRSNYLEDRVLLPDAEDLYADDRPTFALIHLLPPHTPYVPPAPFRGALTGEAAGSPAFDIDPARLRNLARRDPESVTPELIDYARARYDENVMFADDLVGRIVETLRSAGRLDDAIVVVLSDHGEAFFEHRTFLHTNYMWEEYVQVPLVFKWPAGTQGHAPTVTEPVSLIDVLATLVDGAGIGGDHIRSQGRSLLPLAFAGETLQRYIYGYTRGVTMRDQEPARKRVVRDGRYKLVYRDGDASWALFDLQNDPAESVDIAAAEPTRAQLLLERLLLARYQNNLHFRAVGEGLDLLTLDPEIERQLRALGYIR